MPREDDETPVVMEGRFSPRDLEARLAGRGVASAAVIEKAKTKANGLGLFVRSLVGLDREAAKQALAGFLEDKTLNANQIEFVNLIVDHLTARGVVDPGLLYESPFTDKAPQGPDGLFVGAQLSKLIAALEAVKGAASI